MWILEMKKEALGFVPLQENHSFLSVGLLNILFPHYSANIQEKAAQNQGESEKDRQTIRGSNLLLFDRR